MPQWVRLPKFVPQIAAEAPGSMLLETLRFDSVNRHSYLFQRPVRTVIAEKLEDIPGAFSQLDAALAEGFHVAGYFGYECGYHFQPCGITGVPQQGMPLLWLGIYEAPTVFDHATGVFSGPPLPEHDAPSLPEALMDNVSLGITRPEYLAKIATIQEYIASGDTYQVNFTDSVTLSTPQDPAALFTALSAQQSAAYGAMMHIGGHHVLSLSPELFFRIDAHTDNNIITTRPMKGTMPRGLDAAEDIAAAHALQQDAKNRSEHVMIVDLLRNDLGRVCTMGSVQTSDLFSVERYETLLQMTSTVSGTLREGVSRYEIFRSLFPSGSVTGAPKIRTMQIIRELEQRPRGVYTGAIGFFSPQGHAQFNVAIRTLVMQNGILNMGVGGGIIADSRADEEYRECLLKASFLTRTQPEFQIIETMRWDGSSFPLLLSHMERLAASAAYFDFTFDPIAIEQQLAAWIASFAPGTPQRVRLLLHKNGTLALTHAPMPAVPPMASAILSAKNTLSTDVFLRHKTTHRALYESEFAAARANNFDEVIFCNEKGELTEGAISSIFLEHDGRLYTPPLASGVLPGIYRRHVLETHPKAIERILTLDDLRSAGAVFLCNAVRGLQQLRSLEIEGVDILAAELAARS